MIDSKSIVSPGSKPPPMQPVGSKGDQSPDLKGTLKNTSQTDSPFPKSHSFSAASQDSFQNFNIKPHIINPLPSLLPQEEAEAKQPKEEEENEGEEKEKKRKRD
jgi:hypothetical protein